MKENNGLAVKVFLLNRFHRRDFYNGVQGWNSEDLEQFYEKVHLLKENFLPCSDLTNQ